MLVIFSQSDLTKMNEEVETKKSEKVEMQLLMLKEERV